MGYNPQKVIDLAKEEIGYLEKRRNCPVDKLYDKTAYAGTDNWTKYWNDTIKWGLGNYQGQYWCADFITWLFVKAYGLEGARKLLYKLPYISCQGFYDLCKAKQKELGITLVYTTPEKADIVEFWNGSRMHHTELVIDVKRDSYKTVGGNTAANSDIPNGGGVYGPKVYSIAAAKKAGHKFIRIQYNYAEAAWVQEEDKWRYKDAEGNYTKGAWQYINGKWYVFDAAGYMVTGWFKSNDQWYYMCSEGCMDIGWKEENGKWYYFDDSGKMVIGWLLKDNVWYYLKEDGAMLANCTETINGQIYRFKENGVMYCEEWALDPNGKDWYYFSSTGAAYKNTWKQQPDGRWYYLGEDGIMLRDTYIVSAVNEHLFYYLDGSGVWDTTKDKTV